ncbi:uncharacterized protein LOC117557428 [Gymnodraco acuticeps]|uniref:Uncharacterized protein LOC117557428 n=1 Tax=Gymnodraco acuticeps TaxID=8218 RepID=A0A6P8WNR9_GYMAC|nr:uncharacterized protein LOC117557428 [Gymnodraco acuticeps]
MGKIDETPLKKSEHLRGPLGIRIVVTLLAVFISIGIFLVGWGVQHREEPESIRALVENANITNKTSAVFRTFPFTPRAKRSAERLKEGLEILIPRGEAVTVSLDVCDVVVCGELRDKTGHDVYGCIHAWGRPDDNSWCPGSEKVYWSARAEGNNNPPGLAFRSQLSFSKGRHSGDMSKHNPIIIAFKSALTPHFKKQGDVTAFHLLMGIEVPGKDPMGSILVKIIDPPADVIPDLAPKYTESPFKPEPEIPPAKSVNNPLVTYLSTTSIQKVIAVETGYEDTNSWLDWVVYSVKQSKMADCLACAAARPSLGTVPFPFNAHNDPRGQLCMYKLYGQKSPADCVDIAQKYPVVKINDIPPDFTSYEGLYDCITRDYLKGLDRDLCTGTASDAFLCSTNDGRATDKHGSPTQSN